MKTIVFRPLFLCAALIASTAAAEESSARLTGLDLQDLLKQEVTSVSRHSERMSDAAAAVFVISSEDIVRSGAKSIPEALRMAPGVDAVRLSSNRWAVSIRGFNDRFSNKLLVLVDGRNAYHPAFSGVFWETLQVPLEDIERIEVIRGPGAVVWGTNAVNGVVNIITKSAVATGGAMAVVGGGDRHGGRAHLRYGGQLADSTVHYRIYGAVQDSGSFKIQSDRDAYDSFEDYSLGARLDGYTKVGNRWNLSLEHAESRSRDESFFPMPTSPFLGLSRNRQDSQSFSVRSRYEASSDFGAYEIQAAYAHTDVQIPTLGSDMRDTYDLDAQFRPDKLGRDQLILGGGVRATRDKVGDGVQQNFQNRRESVTTGNLYVQDSYALTPDLSATLGVRVEYNRFTQVETLPSFRLRWNASPRRMFWFNFSRAARTPSRAERSFSYILAYQQPPGAPSSIPVTIQGSRDFDTEYLLATEIGYRQQLATSASVDLTLFHHSYEDLRSFVPNPASPSTPLGNQGELDVHGAELSTSWRPSARMYTQLSYAWNQADNDRLVELETSRIVEHLANLRIGFDISNTLSTDISTYYKSARKQGPGSIRIEPFNSMTASLRWQASPKILFSLAGYDLLDRSHVEAQTTVPARTTVEVPRGLYAEVQIQF